MKKSFFRKGASALLAVVMCLSSFLGIGATTAFAAEEVSDTVVMFSFPREGDANFSGNWRHGDLQYMNGWSAGASSKITVYTVGSWSGNACYCIEPGTPLAIGDTMTKRDETYWDNYPSAYNRTISADEIKMWIGRIFQYGYTGNVDIDWRSQNAADADKMAHVMATQTLIWETVVGERDSDFNHVDPGSYDAVNDRISKDNPIYSQYISYYNSIVSNVQKHSKVPSFFAKSTAKAQEIELEWNGTNYSATLTDNNGVLGNYTFSADASGIDFSVSGNTLTITANKAPSDTVSITATKNGSVRRGVVVWSDGVYKPGEGQQDLSTFAAEVNDPVKGYLNLKVSLGSAKIVKTSEDGKVSGISFTITGNGVNQTVKTGSNGEIVIDNLSPGTYTVTEQAIGYYEPQQSKTVTVISGQTATVSFNNVLKRSDLKVIKTSEDNMNEGVKFRLYGTSTSGQDVDLYATTDANGVATFSDVLIGASYTLEEVDTAAKYIVPNSQDAVVEWDAVTEYSFENILKKWRADVFKIDSELADIDVDDNDGPGNNGGAVPMTLLDLDSDEMVEDLGGYYGQTQGNATLAGAVYGVYKGEELIDTYTTDENGYFITDYYVCGDDWSIREITPSEGYLLDPTIYYVDCSAENYTVEHNTEYPDVYEQIIKGDISIIKHTDDGSTQIETPEVGAKFEIYLKSAGSYAEAKETERDMR